MMSPIERAARALCACESVDPDKRVLGFQRVVSMDVGSPAATALEWHRRVPHVIAVVEAIREPTDRMSAAYAALGPAASDDGRPEWAAMIGALLTENP